MIEYIDDVEDVYDIDMLMLIITFLPMNIDSQLWDTLPTQYYDSVLDLYKEDDSVNVMLHYVILCYCLSKYWIWWKMQKSHCWTDFVLADFAVNSSTYVLPHIGHTAKNECLL